MSPARFSGCDLSDDDDEEEAKEEEEEEHMDEDEDRMLFFIAVDDVIFTIMVPEILILERLKAARGGFWYNGDDFDNLNTNQAKQAGTLDSRSNSTNNDHSNKRNKTNSNSNNNNENVYDNSDGDTDTNTDDSNSRRSVLTRGGAMAGAPLAALRQRRGLI
ncbi:hypothetical protein AK812_SmicGene29823 [Symbiodinium microadriaticum]|uniref:Uncharacterized protein n=1 Tax=Symbiodinium microadriaticum TaxID=2951 RepID=A0A1Q9D0U4_SYMMI|nr:hypothetical protein AK812_SmicGene29823 [Symbiodinium microadriaticum]